MKLDFIKGMIRSFTQKCTEQKISLSRFNTISEFYKDMYKPDFCCSNCSTPHKVPNNSQCFSFAEIKHRFFRLAQKVGTKVYSIRKVWLCKEAATSAHQKDLKQNTDKDLRDVQKTKYKNYYNSVLSHYSTAHYKRLVKLVTESKFNMNAKNFLSETPLILAVLEGNLSMVKLFIKHGALVDLADDNGVTPLMYAISNNRKEITEYLLECGANAGLKNNYGTNSLELKVEQMTKQSMLEYVVDQHFCFCSSNDKDRKQENEGVDNIETKKSEDKCHSMRVQQALNC